MEVNKENPSSFKSFFESHKGFYQSGKVWTTDATLPGNHRQDEATKGKRGHLWDMECSAVAALAAYGALSSAISSMQLTTSRKKMGYRTLSSQ